MAATTGAVARFQLSRNNTSIGHHDNSMGPPAAVPKSAASTVGLLDPRLGQAGGGDGSARCESDPNTLKKDKSTSSFKRQLAAARNSRNDETIRRKMAQLKEQQRSMVGGRYPGGARTPIQRDMEAEAKSRVETELGRPVSSNDWPFVYFVVSVDQQPQQVVDGEGGDGTARGMHTARQRQRFLVSRRRKVQEAREETERIREANIDMGLRLEPINPKAQIMDHHQQLQRMRTRPSLSKHPTTPVSSVGSRHEFHFLNSNDGLSDLETRRSIGMIISDTLHEVGLGPRGGGNGGTRGGGSTGRGGLGSKHCPVSTLELPEISAGTKRRALGTSPARNREDGGERKMVTFADSLPVIKGNGIPVLGVKPVDANIPQSASASCLTNLASKPGASPRTGEVSAEGAQADSRAGAVSTGGSYLQPPWSAPLTLRSINSIPKSRMYTPMALPKIDIVSEIYDELIVKTIQNYLMAEGYSQEKFHQLRQTVLARLSATYPHLVTHKAWRQEAPCGNGPVTSTRASSAIPAPGLTSAATASVHGELPIRSRVMRGETLASRHGRPSGEHGLTSSDGFYNVNHNVRPVNLCPFFYPITPSQHLPSDFWLVGGSAGYKASGFPISPSPFMSIDGRTMTITPRLSPPNFSPSAGPVQGPGPAIPRPEALAGGGGDFTMSGWTPPPAAVNHKLSSMVEEEPGLMHCSSVNAQLPAGESPSDTTGGIKYDNEKTKEAENVSADITGKPKEIPESPDVEGDKIDNASCRGNQNIPEKDLEAGQKENEKEVIGSGEKSNAGQNDLDGTEGVAMTRDEDKEGENAFEE